MPLIIEGILTTLCADGGVHVAPMGPVVDEALSSFHLRPFQTSTTFANLKRTGEAVFHVTDDVEVLARAAVGQLDPLPRLFPATAVQGHVLADACRWYALRVRTIDASRERAEIACDLVEQGRLRDFFGFNRAKHAVVETAILATRVGILSRDEIMFEFARLEPLVKKTGGPAEQRAMDILRDYLNRTFAERTLPLSFFAWFVCFAGFLGP